MGIMAPHIPTSHFLLLEVVNLDHVGIHSFINSFFFLLSVSFLELIRLASGSSLSLFYACLMSAAIKDKSSTLPRARLPPTQKDLENRMMNVIELVSG